VTAVLYATPASHPCAVAERALQAKALDYRRVDQIPVLHRLLQRARFGLWTVPGVVFADGEKVGGSRAIVRALEARAPEPSLLPADGELRARVERAEEWGDQVLQPIARRVSLNALSRAPGAARSYVEGARLSLPAPVTRVSAPWISRLSRRVNRVTDADVRADLLALPAHLARVDEWISDGTLGGDGLNAADIQIGASLRLLLTLDDVAPLVAGRPAGSLALRVFPEYPGRVPVGALPSAWLPAPANVKSGH
jgi:glutathione S-transferase